jgi:hypothetical protein
VPGLDTDIGGQGIQVEAAVPWNRLVAGEQQQWFPSGLNRDHWGLGILTGVNWRQCQCMEGPGSADSPDASLNHRPGQWYILDPPEAAVGVAGSQG